MKRDPRETKEPPLTFKNCQYKVLLDFYFWFVLSSYGIFNAKGKGKGKGKENMKIKYSVDDL